MPIRVLVVDDSAFMRKVIREMLEMVPQISVVGTSWSGKDALEQIQNLNPDVVTVDLFMPEMDGVAMIRDQMARRPLPFVVCSSADKTGQKVLDAMDAGAVEFVGKPTAIALEKMYNIQQELVLAVQAAAAVPFDKLRLLSNGHKEGSQLGDLAIHTHYAASSAPERAGNIEAVLIGVSTGGPRALRTILPKIPSDITVPIAIALHMPPGYTGPLAKRLNEISSIEVVESADGVEMQPGRAILAQAGIHTQLKRLSKRLVVTQLTTDPSSSLYFPSVDVLFKTGAEVYAGNVLGVVLTGMGNDGTQGAGWIKASGGQVIVESERTSVVFGMPRAVLEAGLADRVVSLDEIPNAIMEELS